MVRFATGTITSGGNPVAGAQNAAVGLAVDVATNPGEEAAQAPQIITVLVPETGLQKIVPWCEGMTAPPASIARPARAKLNAATNNSTAQIKPSSSPAMCCGLFPHDGSTPINVSGNSRDRLQNRCHLHA